MASVTNPPPTDVAALKDAIYRDGIVGIPNLLSTEWTDELDEDLKKEFMVALSVEGGTAPRGWNRFHFEPYAERVRGFLQRLIRVRSGDKPNLQPG